MSASLEVKDFLRDASNEDIRKFILETLIELLELTKLLDEDEKPNASELH